MNTQHSFSSAARDALALARELADLLAAPDAHERFSRWQAPRVPADWDDFWAMDPADTQWQPPEDETESLPAVNHLVEQLSRAVEVAQMLLARHTDHAMRTDLHQQEWLGIPRKARGFPHTAKYLAETLKISTSDAKQRLVRAEHLTAPITESLLPVDPDLEPLPPDLPRAAEAFRAGTIGPEHADRIISLVKNARRYGERTHTPVDRVEDVIEASEPIVVQAAEQMEPAEFSRASRSYLQRMAHSINDDGPPPRDVVPSKPEQWSVTQIPGGAELRIRTYGLGAELLVMFDRQLRTHYESVDRALTASGSGVKFLTMNQEPLADLADPSAPARDDQVGDHLDRGVVSVEELEAAQAAERQNFPDVSPATMLVADESGHAVSYREDAITRVDDRTADQQVLDAFLAMMLAALRMSSSDHGVPKSRGYDTKMLTVMDLETLMHAYELSLAEPEEEDSVPRRSAAENIGDLHPSELRHLVCEAQMIPVVLDGTGQVVDLGRGRRTFTQKQYEALLARDAGCTVPGCTVAGQWTQAHHIKPWHAEGETNVSNGTLLCPTHHRDVHEGKWTIVRIDADGVWYRSAPWLDPDPRLKRNTYWQYRR